MCNKNQPSQAQIKKFSFCHRTHQYNIARNGATSWNFSAYSDSTPEEYMGSLINKYLSIKSYLEIKSYNQALS